MRLLLELLSDSLSEHLRLSMRSWGKRWYTEIVAPRAGGPTAPLLLVIAISENERDTDPSEGGSAWICDVLDLDVMSAVVLGRELLYRWRAS